MACKSIDKKKKERPIKQMSGTFYVLYKRLSSLKDTKIKTEY